jgi:YidC/Oxa1 family membrane protein insertase
MTALFGVPVDAAYHLVLALTNALAPVLGGFAAVAAIVVFTMAIRLLLAPLSFRALRGQAALTRLAPRIQELRQRYGRQPERLQRELNALYAREGTSLLGGFVPLLAQWPVFSVLYLLFRSSSVAGGPNRLLSHSLFGVPLGNHWLSGSGVLSAQGAVFLGVLAVLAVVCWQSMRVARRMTAATAQTAAAQTAAAQTAAAQTAAAQTAARPVAARTAVARTAAARSGSSGRSRATRSAAAPGSAATRSAAAGSAAAAPGTGGAAALLGKVLPYLTVVIAAFAPLAAAVYLVVSTGWSVGERWLFASARRREAGAQSPVADGPSRQAGGQGRQAGGQGRKAGGQGRQAGGQGGEGGGEISGDLERAGNTLRDRAHRP